MNQFSVFSGGKRLDSLTSRVTPLRVLKSGDTEIFVKDETQQVGGSFKFRGPEHFFEQHPEVTSVVTASSGNHAIGVSYAARRKSRDAYIFIPKDTPRFKQDKIAAAGGIIIPVEGGYEDALRAASDHAKSNDLAFLPSYDHPLIIAGNRALFREAAGQSPKPFDRVSVPVGGGGCISGAIHEFGATGAEILAAEYAPFSRIKALALQGQPDDIVTDHRAETSTEGIAIKTLGTRNKKILASCPNLVITPVTLAELQHACRVLYRDLGIIAELGACAGVAAALAQNNPDKTTLCVITGGNIDRKFHAKIIAKEDI